MIYKISNFSNKEMQGIFNRITDFKIFNALYISGNLYIAYKNYEDYINDPNAFKKILKGQKTKINSIDENNMGELSNQEKEWVNTQLVRLELQDYEYHHQEKLKSIMQTMKMIDAELAQKVEDIQDKNIEEGGELLDG